VPAMKMAGTHFLWEGLLPHFVGGLVLFFGETDRCQHRWTLRNGKLRRFSYIFKWCVIPTVSLTALCGFFC